MALGGRDTTQSAKVVRQSIISRLAPGTREYAIYLPLYNGIDSLSIGVPTGASFERLAPRTEQPIVFYGTSITHGASASRPGMAHVAILGRRLDRPVVNLGFSGNGRMDAAVGDLLVKIDAAVYVIDCLPNMDAAAVTLKCVPLVKQIRAARPTTPIVLVEDRRQTNAWILPALNQFHHDNHAALRACWAALKKEGITGLYYLEGDDLLGDDAEAATDGSHPSDLGMVRQADRFEPVLRKALARKEVRETPRRPRPQSVPASPIRSVLARSTSLIAHRTSLIAHRSSLPCPGISTSRSSTWSAWSRGWQACFICRACLSTTRKRASYPRLRASPCRHNST
jgi:hypothetical protein